MCLLILRFYYIIESLYFSSFITTNICKNVMFVFYQRMYVHYLNLSKKWFYEYLRKKLQCDFLNIYFVHCAQWAPGALWPRMIKRWFRGWRTIWGMRNYLRDKGLFEGWGTIWRMRDHLRDEGPFDGWRTIWGMRDHLGVEETIWGTRDQLRVEETIWGTRDHFETLPLCRDQISEFHRYPTVSSGIRTDILLYNPESDVQLRFGRISGRFLN